MPPLALRHRGQESCGTAAGDTQGPKGKAVSARLEISDRAGGGRYPWGV